jgi:hypothetical protein
MTGDEAKRPSEADEAERWAKEAQEALAPVRKHSKGSHEYPSVSCGPSLYNSVPPLGHKATLRKLRD